MADPTRRQIAMMANAVGITDYSAAVELVRRAFEVSRSARAALAADGPAVQSREPASVAHEPSDQELLELMPETMRDEFAHAASVCSDMTGGRVKPGIFRVCLNTATLEYARAVLARYGHQPAPPVGEEVAELVAEIRHFLAGYRQIRGLDPEYVYSIHQGDAMEAHIRISRLARAADLLAQRPEPVPAGMIPVEYWDINSGARIVTEPSEEGPGDCWVVLNSRQINPFTEFPTAKAAWDALQLAALREAHVPTPVPVSERLPGPQGEGANG